MPKMRCTSSRASGHSQTRVWSFAPKRLATCPRPSASLKRIVTSRSAGGRTVAAGGRRAAGGGVASGRATQRRAPGGSGRSAAALRWTLVFCLATRSPAARGYGGGAERGGVGDHRERASAAAVSAAHARPRDLARRCPEAEHAAPPAAKSSRRLLQAAALCILQPAVPAATIAASSRRLFTPTASRPARAAFRPSRDGRRGRRRDRARHRRRPAPRRAPSARDIGFVARRPRAPLVGGGASGAAAATAALLGTVALFGGDAGAGPQQLLGYSASQRGLRRHRRRARRLRGVALPRLSASRAPRPLRPAARDRPHRGRLRALPLPRAAGERVAPGSGRASSMALSAGVIVPSSRPPWRTRSAGPSSASTRQRSRRRPLPRHRGA